MKLIIIGTSLAGKTTIVRELRKNYDLPVSEIDEELTRINGGQFPTNPKYKHEILAPKVIDQILKLENIIFFTNTNYFLLEDLEKARNNNFKIIQLEVNLDELHRRNVHRVNEEGYDDLSEWFVDMLEYQKEIKDAGLVDSVIDASKSTDKIVSEILENTKK